MERLGVFQFVLLVIGLLLFMYGPGIAFGIGVGYWIWG